jgi:hypothetical protein
MPTTQASTHARVVCMVQFSFRRTCSSCRRISSRDFRNELREHIAAECLASRYNTLFAESEEGKIGKAEENNYDESKMFTTQCVERRRSFGCAPWTAGGAAHLSAAEIATRYDFKPKLRNAPVGEARGIHPGRVVWAHDPEAARWSGHVAQNSGHWWTDASTDQQRVDAMLSRSLRSLTGAESDESAWAKIFGHYNQRAHGTDRGYLPGEAVAVKVNLNSSSAEGPGNIVNVSPQVALAMVRQLVRGAKVREADIIVYDARRAIYPAVLTKIWTEFPDVRFVQWEAPAAPQPTNPHYGDYRGLEGAQWVEGVSYSVNQNEYYDAKLIPKQIKDATYLVNVALLKAHSYPYSQPRKAAMKDRPA